MPLNPSKLSIVYPKNGAQNPRKPVMNTCAPMYSASSPTGANLVTHKLHAIEAPPLAIPAKAEPKISP